jgi:fucose permease
MIATKTAQINYRVVIIAYLSFIALGLPGGLLGVAWPSIRDTFGLEQAALGTLLFTTTAGYLTASVFNGRIISRIGVAKTLLIATALIAIGLLGIGLAPGWWPLIVIALVLGLGQGIVDAGLNLYFANNFNARLMNWLHAAFGLGAALGPLLMTELFRLEQSWRVGYFAIAAVHLVMVTLFAITLSEWQNPTSQATQTEAANPSAPSIFDTLRHPPVLFGILLFFVFTGMESTAGNWGFTMLTESRMVDIIVAGQWISLYWWSFTLGRLVFGFIGDRIPVKTAVWACMFLMLAGAVLLTLNLSDVLSFVGLIVLGFALAPIFPLLMTVTPERIGKDHATNAIGFQVGAAGLGIAISPALAGVIAGATSLEAIGPFLIASAALTIALYFLVERSHT